jgi:ABC-type glycerol-3-phosphate transport system permease component
LRWLNRLILLSAALSILLPLGWIGLASLRPSADVFLDPLGWPQRWTLDNFVEAFALSGFARYFWNSLWVTAASTSLTVILGAALAYSLARFQLPASALTQAALATGLVIPLQLVVLPLFFMLKKLGLLGTHWGLILVYTASGVPYAVLLLRAFFARLPQDLYEAALLDGCSPSTAFWRIFLPLARPGLTTVGLFTALSIYNEYFLAFILLSGHSSESLRTLPLGLAHLTIVSQYRADFGQLYAGVVMVMLPSLALYGLAHRHLMKGLSEGAVKG